MPLIFYLKKKEEEEEELMLLIFLLFKKKKKNLCLLTNINWIILIFSPKKKKFVVYQIIVCQTNKESQNHLSICVFWKISAIVLFLYVTKKKKKKSINIPFMCYGKVFHFYSYHGLWVVYALVVSTAHNSKIHLLVGIISTVICRVKGPV